MVRIFLLLGVLFCGVVFSDCEQARGQSYPVTLTRPSKVGDRYSVDTTAKFSKRRDATVEENFNVHLVGDINVLAVNAKTGEATKIEFTVVKFTREDREIMPAGTVVTGERAKTLAPATYEISGTPVDRFNARMLVIALPISSAESSTSNDDAIGTSQPQKVGDVWPIHADVVAKQMGEDGLTVSPSAVNGEAKLDDVRQIAGKTVEDVDVNESMSGASASLPNGTMINDASTSITYHLTMPQDVALPPISISEKLHSEMDVFRLVHGSHQKSHVVSDRELITHLTVKK